MAPMPVVALVLNCPTCGRGGEATISEATSEDVSPSAEHADFVVHTISPEFKVIKASILESDEFFWRRKSENARILAVLLAKANFSRVEHDGLTARKSEAG